eukprot:XP_019925287.1 PREDICTED: uncharacterized protein LOC109619517 [Crassostrea gigas]
MPRIPNLIFIIYFSLSNLMGLENLPTKETSGLCSTDHLWDSKKLVCKECDAGFYGINCSKLCRYPNYGHECQNQCNCSQTACDHKIGCPIEILNAITESSKGDDKRRQPSENNTIVIVATLTTGFLLVIVSIIVVTKLLKRHFSRRILTTERNIDSFVVECIMREDRASSRESAVNYAPRVCYETLYSDI